MPSACLRGRAPGGWTSVWRPKSRAISRRASNAIAVFANPDYEQIAFVRSIFGRSLRTAQRPRMRRLRVVGRTRAIKTLHVEVKGEPEDRIVKPGKRFGSRCCCSTRARARCWRNRQAFAWWSSSALARDAPIIRAGD